MLSTRDNKKAHTRRPQGHSKDGKRVRIAKTQRRGAGQVGVESPTDRSGERWKGLIEKYGKEVAPALLKRFAYGSPMATPRLTKVVINMGVGDAIAGCQDPRPGGGGAGHDRRAATGDHAGP